MQAYPKSKRTDTLASALVFLGSVFSLLDLARHRQAVPTLADVTRPTTGQGETLPRLSVIVPACNEEGGIRAAVDSMLAQDYPDLEIILVNDRSTDRTGEVMDALVAARPGRARTLTIEALPPHWLGKNHALWRGARESSGDWLLFADADIVFDPTCFRRAVAYAEAERLDHLTLSPEIVVRGYWLQAFVAFFVYGFAVTQRPYRANDPHSKVGVGVGAFNLIRRPAYDAIGTHQALSLRPDDDVRLGKRVKLLALRQRLLHGAPLVRVDWYPSLGVALRAFDKNAFAGLNYSVLQSMAAVSAVWVLCVWPYLAVWRVGRAARLLLLGSIGSTAISFASANRPLGRGVAAYFPAFPVAAILWIYVFLRSMILALTQGGVYWRGTFYLLRQLKSQSGLEGT